MNTEHERALALRRRYGLPVEDVPWHTRGLPAQIVFFALTLIGVAALYWFLPEAKGIITAVFAIALAEYLIRRHRWSFTGVESALWIGGLFAPIIEDGSLLLFAAASAIAGARVRNPLFGALAAGFAMHHVEDRYDLGVLFALASGVFAILALCRTWQRPSTEGLWMAIAILLPLAGYAEADREWRSATIALYAGFGVVAFIAAIARRHHALFAAAAIGFAVAVIEVSREIDIAVETKLAIAGAFLLALSLAVSRLLHDRTTGLVTTKQSTEEEDFLEIAATVTAKPPDEPIAADGRPQGDGQFGGAGASGSY